MGASVSPVNKLIGLNLLCYFRNSEIILTKDNSQKPDRTTKRPYFGKFQLLAENEIILFCAWGGYSELLGSAVTNVWW